MAKNYFHTTSTMIMESIDYLNILFTFAHNTKTG